jgi:hypothetical protein
MNAQARPAEILFLEGLRGARLPNRNAAPRTQASTRVLHPRPGGGGNVVKVVKLIGIYLGWDT